MYNANSLKTALIGLVGWRQNHDPSGWQLTELTASSSGLWFNSVHPMLTFDNLRSICPKFNLVEADQAATNTAFTGWVKEKTEDWIVEAIGVWFNQKSGIKTANNLLERKDLFYSTTNSANTEDSSGKIVGFQVDTKNNKGLQVEIKRIGLQLTQNQSLRVNLFKSGQNDSVANSPIAYTANGGVQWETVDWVLESGHSYFIAYDQDDLVGEAVNGLIDYSIYQNGRTKYPTAKYFDVAGFSADVDDSSLWDLSKNSHTISTNYGLNLSFSVKCDYTDFVIDQASIFADYLRLYVGMGFLNEIANNPNANVNRNESNASARNLKFDINGDSQGKDDFSVHGKVKKALSAIQFDTAGIDKICLPCRRRSIRHKTIGPKNSGWWYS